MATRIRHRIGWFFHRSTSPAERQMESFRTSQLALARATERNRPSTV